MDEIKVIEEFPDKEIVASGSISIADSEWMTDFYVGDDFKGSWGDIVSFACEVLGSQNTWLIAPKLYNREWSNSGYVGCIYDKEVDLPVDFVSGGKRVNLMQSNSHPQLFFGFGKDESCVFEGSWGHMVAFACEVLACDNTKLIAPELYREDWKNEMYQDKIAKYEVRD